MSGKQVGLVNGDWVPPTPLRNVLSNMLTVLGFKSMASQVLDEEEAGLRQFAATIVQAWPVTPHPMNGLDRQAVIRNLQTLKLI